MNSDKRTQRPWGLTALHGFTLVELLVVIAIYRNPCVAAVARGAAGAAKRRGACSAGII